MTLVPCANLRTARELAGLSIGQAARVTGIGRARLAEVESAPDGAVGPSEGEMAAFCRAYHVTEEGLLRGHDFAEFRAEFARVPGFNALAAGDQEQVLRLVSFLRVAGPKPRSEDA